jgi:hypothetical protein
MFDFEALQLVFGVILELFVGVNPDVVVCSMAFYFFIP